MAKHKTKTGQVASVVITLALALVETAQPSRSLVLIISASIAGCFLYWFGGWAFGKRRTIAEQIGRISILCLVSAAASFGYGWQFWPTIQLSPEHVTFNPKINNQSYTFIFRNKTGDDVYSVESIFTPETITGLRPDIPKDSRKPVVDESDMADITAIMCHDMSGKDFYLFSIHHMGPQESREISFTNTSQNNAISASLTYFTRDAEPRINDPLKMQQTFHSPDAGTSCNKALSFWLDPTRPPKSIDATATLNHSK